MVAADSPTLGAIRRRHGHTDDMCAEARALLAFELIQEARRRAIADQLAGVFVGLDRGADPDIIARRLRRLADLIDPPNVGSNGRNGNEGPGDQQFPPISPIFPKLPEAAA